MIRWKKIRLKLNEVAQKDPSWLLKAVQKRTLNFIKIHGKSPGYDYVGDGVEEGGGGL